MSASTKDNFVHHDPINNLNTILLNTQNDFDEFHTSSET